ncbi:MAG: cytochrome P450, partial [Proteobacteria bacterium]|nr:cytochrome P450 [Pseudomonadota bacterium]
MNIAVKVEAAAEDIAALPLEALNPGKTERFQDDTIWPVFERLRREDPVHFTPDSEYGPYWSLTRWDDIMAVDTNHEVFSSAEGIGLANLENVAQQEAALRAIGQEPRRGGGAGFITMDEPEHGPARKAVSPTLAPANLATMAPVVRERAGLILDSLPIGQEFDWVDLVSKELT